jgi:hypothetical protein
VIRSPFMFLDKAPRSSHGKMDRTALPARVSSRTALDGAYEAPRIVLKRHRQKFRMRSCRSPRSEFTRVFWLWAVTRYSPSGPLGKSWYASASNCLVGPFDGSFYVTRNIYF